MLLDDSVKQRTMTQWFLESLGHKVFTSPDAFDALEKLERPEANIDLVISNVNMPHMDGYRFLKNIRNNDELKSIPILFLTTESDRVSRDELKMQGASAWVAKPFNPRNFKPLINELLASVAS